MKNNTILDQIDAATIISANIEWNVIREIFPSVEVNFSPFGEWFIENISIISDENNVEKKIKVIYFQGGWGKISAAASTQYIIDCWKPKLVLNLGTCGGFKDEIDRGTLILAEKTIVYDIYEQMYSSQDHIDHYTTELDVSWIKEDFPVKLVKTVLVSGDKDLSYEDIPKLKDDYQAVAGDWESGAIAFISRLNRTPAIILRGVTDLVSKDGGEAYTDVEIFERNTRGIITKLVQILPYIFKSSKFL